ncbi:MAG: porin [Alphaproteobacteria bacterium]|nr:MAG: porin [Alphaproteobacteria bacterium]
MKKILFASTALVAASVAGASMASEPLSASLHGYMHVGLIYQDNNNDPDLGVLNDGEIHFRFRGVSDNGLTFSGKVELESFTTGDQIDEYWTSVSGSFGSIGIGADDSAADWSDKGVIYGPGAHAAYFDGFYSILFSRNGSGDDPSIRYTSPNFSGFQIAADWAPDDTADPGNQQITFGNNQQRWSIGAIYDGSFSGFDIGIGGSYLDGDLYVDPIYAVGVDIGWSGFQVSAHYENDSINDPVAIGASYKTGPWTFGGGVSFATNGPDLTNWGVWAAYSIMPGATATLSYEGNDRNAGYNTTVLGYLSLSF